MKRVVFEFDERSEIPLDKLREMGFMFVAYGDWFLPESCIKGCDESNQASSPNMSARWKKRFHKLLRMYESG